MKFNFNPFCTFQDMNQTGIHYGKNWLWGDNYENIQGRIVVLVHCSSPECHLSINQVPFQSLLYLARYCSRQASMMTNTKLRRDNSVNITGRIMVLGFCPFSAIYLYSKFDLNDNSSFKVICRTRYRLDGQMDRAATICFLLGGA